MYSKPYLPDTACVRHHDHSACIPKTCSPCTRCALMRGGTHMRGCECCFYMPVLPIDAEYYLIACRVAPLFPCTPADRSTHAIAIGKLGCTKSTATTCSNHRMKPCSINSAGKYQRSRAYQFLLATLSKQATKSLTIWYGFLLPTNICSHHWLAFRNARHFISKT